MNLLVVENVTKNYSEHCALDNVSLAVPKGSIFGLLGPNGAGKTSLIRIINQITAPDSGEIFIDNEKLSPKHISQIGYLPEERGLYKKMKVGEQLLYLAQLKGMTKVEAMDKLKVWFEKFEIKDWWNKPVEDLSKGMQQKIQFVATVLHQPKLIILDEPFSGFDPINATLIKDEILELKENGSTIIFSTHRMESVEQLCDHIALINKSKNVLEGNKEEIRNQFKSNTYNLQFKGDLPSNFNSFDIVSRDKHEAILKLRNGFESNQMLAELLPVVQIISFSEDIPSMNEIFLNVVNSSN